MRFTFAYTMPNLTSSHIDTPDAPRPDARSRTVEVTFYGNLVRLAGARSTSVRVEGEDPTVADLREALRRELPFLDPHLDTVAVGVGTDLVSDDAPLPTDGSVALLPPVSGG